MDFWVKEFNDKGDILMEKFRSLADGKTLVTFSNEINRFGLDVISSVIYLFTVAIDFLNYVLILTFYKGCF